VNAAAAVPPAEGILERTVTVGQLQAADLLTRRHPMLAPCGIEPDGDSLLFRFPAEGYTECTGIFEKTPADRYRFLFNAGALEQLAGQYDFSLSPDNLLVDDNLKPKVLVRLFGTNGSFLERYKALIGAVLTGRYDSDDFLGGGADLYGSQGTLRELADLPSVKEVRGRLFELWSDESRKQKAATVSVNRLRDRLCGVLIPALSVLTALCLAVSCWYALAEIPRLERLSDAFSAYQRGEYGRVIETLGPFDPDDLDIEELRILAKSYVRAENLSERDKDAATGALDRTQSKLYCRFWIYLGRMEFDKATDTAQGLADLYLEAVAITKELDSLHDMYAEGKISGGERQTLEQELKSRLEFIRERLDEANA